MRRLLILMCFGILLSCSDEALAPEAAAYPPLESSAYCSGYDPVTDPVCNSLTVRRRYVRELEAMEFEQVSEFECSLEDPETAERFSFQCGKLLFGLVEGVEEEDLERVLELTDGVLTRFPSGPFAYGSLTVPLGTEVEAISTIIFNPDLRYVTLHRLGGVLA